MRHERLQTASGSPRPEYPQGEPPAANDTPPDAATALRETRLFRVSRWARSGMNPWTGTQSLRRLKIDSGIPQMIVITGHQNHGV
jgi:hypothetical protein